MAEAIQHNLREFTAALAEYRRLNTRELGPLLESRATRLRYRVWRLFREIAPEKAGLEAELRDRVKQRLGLKRGIARSGKRRTAEQEIKSRRAGVFFSSASWLARGWKRAPQGQQFLSVNRSRRGKAIGVSDVKTAKGIRSPRVEIVSFLQSVEAKDKELGLIDRAYALEAADMRTYIARKQDERARATLGRVRRLF